MSFAQFVESLKPLEPLFGLVTTILWGIYIYYTIKTFREIKRQTDLQSQAFLVVAAKLIDILPENKSVAEESLVLHKKWREIVSTNVPAAEQSDKYLVLEFTNRGRSDIVSWDVFVTATISPGEYLERNFNTSSEMQSWTISYRDHKDNIPPDGKIEIPIAVCGMFPKVMFRWIITYRDIRREEMYRNFSGDTHLSDQNALASPVK